MDGATHHWSGKTGELGVLTKRTVSRGSGGTTRMLVDTAAQAHKRQREGFEETGKGRNAYAVPQADP